MARKPGENRGGARKGAGRPPGPAKVISDASRKRLEKALKAKAIETGVTLEALAVRLAYDDNLHEGTRLGYIRLLMESRMVKESHATKEVINYEPVILPALRDDPAQLEEWSGEGH